jgi:hypothetical protein
MSYICPTRGVSKFTCPHCGAIAKQNWMGFYWNGTKMAPAHHMQGDLGLGKCDHCQESTVWVGKIQVFPDVTNAPHPNEDLPELILELYSEAASISTKSPRGAAALLRLAVQFLCKELGESGENINNDIASLVNKGLPIEIQQSLDFVRVIGNNAVHPGQIDTDNPEVVNKLFGLVNIIAEYRISMPKRVAGLYGTLPQQVREQIQKRDE